MLFQLSVVLENNILAISDEVKSIEVNESSI